EKGKTFIFTATVAVKPEVTLGEYKGIEVEVEKAEVTDEEVNAELDKVRDQNSRMVTVEDRPVENGDIAVIDYEGFCDGVAFAGGKGTDHALTIGSHSFIDTFEEQLIGKNIGEEVDVNVTFPEEYHAPELAGKPALFKVTIKKINKKELPELDDEFAQEASEFDTLDEYKADIKATLLEKKTEAAKSKKEDAVVDKIIENATMEIPQPMIDSKKYQMAEDYAQRLQASGLSIDQYFKFTGMTVESFMETLAPQALKAIQYRLVLEAVVKAENIVISDEEIDAEMQKLADAYKMELDKVKEIITGKEKDEFVMDIAVRKAIDVVRDAAVEK
ncbi:MAG: trigger factor, partial [Clostridia bacterium]|nr:trigger factor [Clostridia bacterium]